MRQHQQASPTHSPSRRSGPFFPGGASRATGPAPPPFFQARLRIGEPGDRFEREADQVADAVATRGAAPPVQRMCTECAEQSERELRRQPEEDEEVDPVQAKAEPGSGEPGGSGLTGRLQASAGNGQALPAPVLADMNAAFGRDFGGVRVHSGGAAAQMSRELGAQAFTHGQDIYFGGGKFAPESAPGRHLLAHELTHVLQQGGGGSGLVQRAEVDDRSCTGLTDIESDVDTKVNDEIAAARKAAGKPLSAATLVAEVHDRLGKGAVSPIEKFIEALPASKRNLPGTSLSGTKYAGVEAVNRFYNLQTLGLAHVVGSAAKVHGICIGADKLGHFFGEGNLYFRVLAAGGTTADTESLGRFAEITIQGLQSTGVFSNADLVANRTGLKFYQDLVADPTGFTFQIQNYITPSWNERTNPSFYDAPEAAVIWKNLLTGTWEGPVAVGKPGLVQTRIVFTATTGGDVTGDYEFPAAKPTGKGKIKNGKISFQTASISGTQPGTPPKTQSATPVKGITIEFDWERTVKGKLMKGKGKWGSVGEDTLHGTWGRGSARSGGGDWDLAKV